MNVANERSFFYDLKDFQVQITNLMPGERTPLIVTVPSNLRVNGKPYGINTSRANAVVGGEIEFSRKDMVPFVKGAGESPQNDRVAYGGEYWLKAVGETPATFACIVAKHHQSLYYDYDVIQLKNGDVYDVEEGSSPFDLFLVKGQINVNEMTFENFRHFSITGSKKLSFSNESMNDAYLIKMFQIGVSGAQQLASIHFPDNLADFDFQ